MYSKSSQEAKKRLQSQPSAEDELYPFFVNWYRGTKRMTLPTRAVKTAATSQPPRLNIIHPQVLARMNPVPTLR